MSTPQQPPPRPGYQQIPAGRGGYVTNPTHPEMAGSDQSGAINQYRPPRNPMPLVVTLLSLVLVGALVMLGRTVADRQSELTPTPTPSVTTPSPSHSGKGIPVQPANGRAEAYWEITTSQWTSRGLELTMSITGTRGTLDFRFFALDTKSTTQFHPRPASHGNYLGRGSVQEGQTVTGTLVFEKSRGDTMVVIADGTGRQITALQVDA